jgi:hypothetical protein
MLKILLCFLLPSFAACAQNTPATAPLADDKEALQTSLSETDTVDFYFVSRTGNYVLSPVDLKNQATISISRNCGANCNHFMRDVIDHLMEAKPAECQVGKESVLISWGNTVITCSYSGRMIKYKSKCFYNDVPINNLVKKTNFIFK